MWKGCVFVIMIKIVLLLVKNVFFGLNEGISKKVCQVTQKHTAQLPLHLLVLILKGKNTSSSPLTLKICGLILHSWLFTERQLYIFMLVKVDKNVNLANKHLLINPSILLYISFFFIKLLWMSKISSTVTTT